MAKSLHDPRYKAVVARLVQLRKSAGLTQRDVAERLDETPSYVAKYELCERRLDVVELFAVLVAVEADAASVLKEIATSWRRGGKTKLRDK